MDSTSEQRPRRVERTKDELADAFPLVIRQDALAAVAVLSENRFSSRWQSFYLHLGHELLSLPQRIYYAPPLFQTQKLSALQAELQDCLFTRHHDGFVRQARLLRIIRSSNAWIPCFVIPLVGEYVFEILQVICENLSDLDKHIYSEFVRSNPEFIDLTEQRVTSYWDCYHRSIRREDYPGFLILDFLRSRRKQP